jgi:hypothetical protein
MGLIVLSNGIKFTSAIAGIVDIDGRGGASDCVANDPYRHKMTTDDHTWFFVCFR